MKRSCKQSRICILCGNESGSGVSLFRFPENETRSNAWMNAISGFIPRVANLSCQDLKGKLICEEHFQEDCFISSLKNRLHRYAQQLS